MEKCKLFVSGLSYDLTREDIEKEFSKVRIPIACDTMGCRLMRLF